MSSKYIACGLIFSLFSETSQSFHTGIFKYVGTVSMETSQMVVQEIGRSQYPVTNSFCSLECIKVPGCRGVEVCRHDDGSRLCRLWIGPFAMNSSTDSLAPKCKQFSIVSETQLCISLIIKCNRSILGENFQFGACFRMFYP